MMNNSSPKLALIWVGYHPELGVVIYDPTLQDGIEKHLVKLYQVNCKKFSLFNRDEIRRKTQSLKKHLNSIDAEINKNNQVIGKFKKYYLANISKENVTRPNITAINTFSVEAKYDDSQFQNDKDDEERKMLIEEFMDDQNAWERSNEEGWFYED